MRFSCSLLCLLIVANLPAISQWTSPQPVETVAASYEYGKALFGIATGPHRELAIVALRRDTLICYFSTNNGRTFSRSVVATQSHIGDFFEDIGSVDGIAFDSQGNLFILWRMILEWDLTEWFSYRLSKSTDEGRTFSLFWSSRYLGTGIFPSVLTRSGFSIDSQDRVHCVYDSAASSGRPTSYYVYMRFAANDPTNLHRAVLTGLLSSGYSGSAHAGSASIVAGENTVDVALSGEMPVTLHTGLFYFHSTDAGITFSSPLQVDTVNARNPTLLQLPGNALFLAHASAQLGSSQDTSLVIRRKADTSFSGPFQLIGTPGCYVPASVRSRDSTLHIAYTRYQTNSSAAYYHLNVSGGAPLDSLILPGHTSPDLAIDSLGRIYLVSLYQNRIYLSTRNVLLAVPQNPGKPSGPFQLHQNYPNPFNPSTVIAFNLPQQSQVLLTVYDVLGRKVAALIDGVENAGRHETVFQSENLASGVYFYRLSAGGFVQTRKMIVQK